MPHSLNYKFLLNEGMKLAKVLKAPGDRSELFGGHGQGAKGRDGETRTLSRNPGNGIRETPSFSFFSSPNPPSPFSRASVQLPNTKDIVARARLETKTLLLWTCPDTIEKSGETVISRVCWVMILNTNWLLYRRVVRPK